MSTGQPRIPAEIDTPNIPLLEYFFTVQITGGVGVLIVLLTVLLSSRVRRHTVWTSFCVTWIISVVSYCLLLIAGQQTGAQPNPTLCLIQASMIYGAPVLTAQSMLCLVCQLWSTLKRNSSAKVQGERTAQTILLLVFPYTIYVLALVESLVIGLLNPTKVVRAPSDIYCIISNTIPGKVSGVIVIITEAITIFYEARIGLIVYYNWRHFNRPDTTGSISPTLMIRVAVFTFFGFVTIAASLVLLSHVASIVPNVFIAIMPLAAFLVFGTQLDIVRVWIFWRPAPPPARLSVLSSAHTSSSVDSSIKTTDPSEKV